MCHCQQTIWTEGLDQKQAMDGLSNRSWGDRIKWKGKKTILNIFLSSNSLFNFSPSCSEDQIFRNSIITLKDLLQHLNGMLIFCLHSDSPKKHTIFSWFVFCDILITCSISCCEPFKSLPWQDAFAFYWNATGLQNLHSRRIAMKWF